MDAAISVDDTSTKEHEKRVKDAGWIETTAFNYEDFQRTDGDDADWHGAAQVYEWSDEYGDVGPEVPELEKMLFGGEFQMRRGEHLENLELHVEVEGPINPGMVRKVSTSWLLPVCLLPFTDANQFDDMGLHPVVLNNIKLARYEFATPIQSYTIPAVLQGMDVVAVAQTGKS